MGVDSHNYEAVRHNDFIPNVITISYLAHEKSKLFFLISLFLISVRENRRDNQEWTIQRNLAHEKTFPY
jgi:hypothetical protein